VPVVVPQVVQVQAAAAVTLVIKILLQAVEAVLLVASVVIIARLVVQQPLA